MSERLPHTVRHLIERGLGPRGRQLLAIAATILVSAGIFAENTAESNAIGLPEPTVSSVDTKPKLPKYIIDYANAPSGYAIGNLTDNDTFVYSGIKEKDAYKRVWRYGLMKHLGEPTDDECGWIKAREVSRSSIETDYKTNICGVYEDDLRDRDSIGADFNCADHSCDDGKFTRVQSDCDHQLALNYNEREGHSYDILNVDIPDVVYFRYLNNDHTKKWSRLQLNLSGRDSEEGIDVWAPVPGSCIAGIPRGGPDNPAWP